MVHNTKELLIILQTPWLPVPARKNELSQNKPVKKR